MFAAVSLLFAAPARAQRDSASRWTASTSLGAAQTSGSTSYTSLNGAQSVLYGGSNWESSFEITASYARDKYRSPDTDASGNTIGTTTRISAFRQWMTELDTHLSTGGSSYWIERAELERDDNQAVRRRIFAAAGAGLNVLKNARDHVKVELTSGPLIERDLNGSLQRYTALSALAGFAFAIGRTGGMFSGSAEALKNLHAHDDVIFRSLTSLSAPLTHRIALALTYQLTDDTKPNVGIFDADSTDDVVTVPQRRNSTLSASISVSW